MYCNSLARAGLAVSLSLFLFFSVVCAAPLSVHDYGSTSSDADISCHNTPTDIARGIIHHVATSDQSSKIVTPLTPPSIFKRDAGDFQLVFPTRRSFWDKFKGAFKKLASGVKRVAHTIASGVKRVGNTVAHFVNDNKNKIAKVGLKVLSVAEKYGAKALANVPGIGKPLSKGLEIASKYTDRASNRIHANLGGNLGKAMAGLDKAE